MLVKICVPHDFGRKPRSLKEMNFFKGTQVHFALSVISCVCARARARVCVCVRACVHECACGHVFTSVHAALPLYHIVSSCRTAAYPCLPLLQL